MVAGVAGLVILTAIRAEEPAPAAPPETAPSAKGADLDLLQEVRAIAGRLEAVRGAKLSSPPLAVRAPEELRAMIAEARTAAALPPARLAARGRAWTDLGLGSADTPARVVKLLASDLDGAAWDSAGRRILIDPTRLAASDFEPDKSGEAATSMLLATGLRPDEPLVAHLLIHALQHQRRGDEPDPQTTDGLLASAAWAEGEANLVAMLYLFHGMGLGREVVERALDPGEVLGGALLPSSLGGAPPTEKTLVDFVYRDGFHQVLDRFRAGGWVKVEEAEGARRSTRDVYHLDRPPLPRSAGVPCGDAPAGFVAADADSIGEIGIVTLVSELTGKDNLGLQAGDGWVGDSLCRFESPDASKGFTLWVTRLATPEAAADFEYAVTRGISEKLSGAAFQQTGPGRRALSLPDRVYRVTKDGTEVRLRIAPAAIDRTLEPAPQHPIPPKKPPKKAPNSGKS